MSSPELPRLDIDVRQRRAERWVAVIGTALALVLPWLIVDSLTSTNVVDMAVAGGAGLFMAVASLAGFYRAGWLAGSQRIERVIWSGEGYWLLFDGAGRARETSLTADTRIGTGCLWLRWQTANPRSMLLLPGDMPADQLRRLSVRLRIDRRQAVAITRMAAI